MLENKNLYAIASIFTEAIVSRLRFESRSGLPCPDCGDDKIKTEGIMGLFAQAAIHLFISRLKREGGRITPQCGHTWDVSPSQKNNPK